MSGPVEVGRGVTLPDLGSAVSAAFKAADGARAYRPSSGLSMSALGGCRRRAAYKIAGAPQERRLSESRQAWLGTWQHAGLLPLLAEELGGETERGCGWTVREGAPPWRSLRLGGHVDLFATPLLVDLKTVGEYGLSRVLAKGPSTPNLMQTHGYAAALREAGEVVEEIALLYLNRASGETHVERFPVDEGWIEAARTWALQAEEWGLSDPEAAPRDEKGPGLSIVCDGCEFLRLCWGADAEPGEPGPQRRILAEAPIESDAVASAAAMLYDARDRMSRAKADAEFARAVLSGTDAGTYGEGWRVRWRRGYTKKSLDEAAARALLDRAGLPVPVKTTTVGGSLLIDPPPHE